MEIKPQLPVNIPEIVYKYRDWKNDFQRRTIINKELFLASPKLFNDPFDCKIPIAYWKLAEDPQLKSEYFSQFVKGDKPDLSKPEYIKEVEKLMKDEKWEDQKWLEEQEIIFFDELGKIFGVLSLSQFKDDIRMWTHYSNSHTGYCIGFKSKKLFFDEPRFGSGGKVEYVKEFPIILPTEEKEIQYTKILYTKFKIWCYEQEYRLIKIDAANKVVNFEENEVAEIIIGNNTLMEDEKSILNICNCNFPNIPVFKAKQERNEFKLKFERIN